MANRLYIIDYESAHWCGGQSYVVVWAESEDDAQDIACSYMDETMRELFADEHSDEEFEHDDDQAHTVNSVEEFGPEHDCWKWYKDPSQECFYPTIGEPD